MYDSRNVNTASINQWLVGLYWSNVETNVHAFIDDRLNNIKAIWRECISPIQKNVFSLKKKKKRRKKELETIL